MVSKKVRLQCMFLQIFLVLGLLAAYTPAGRAQELATAANDVVRDVGNVESLNPSGRMGPVFVFEEFHTSRVGQLQIAVMLLRLRDRLHLRAIGLEGAVSTGHPLDGTWFQRIGNESTRSVKEDVAVRMLGEGEISSAEFLALLFPDVSVYGTETEEEYRVQPAENTPEIGYLLDIAEKDLTAPDIARVNTLLKAKKDKEAYEYMLNADPWVRERYKGLSGGTISAEAMVNLIGELQTKAQQVGANVDPKDEQGMGQELHFWQVTSGRSETMIKNTLGLPGLAAGDARAMIVGAAHAERVTQLLRQRGVRFVLIKPLALNPKFGQMSVAQFEAKGKARWIQTSDGSLGRLLNSPHKPPPIIETATAKSFASLQFAAIAIARAAAGGGRIPDDVWPEISDLPECTIDRGSFTVLGHDVIFSASLTRTDGSQRLVWARVGTSATPAQAETLEQKLFQSIADLGGGGRVPPRNPPPNTTFAKDEGPGDGKRGRLVISRVGLRELAVYGASKTDLLKAGRLSS